MVAASIALTMLAGACLGRHGTGSALRAEAVTGTVDVRPAGATTFRPADKGDRFGPGSDVRTGAGSSVVLARDDGAKIEVGALTGLRIETVTHVTVSHGSVLAAAPGVPFTVTADGVDAGGGKAVFRVDVGFSLRVGSYGGTVTVGEDGQSLRVSDFRQVEIAGGVFPREAVPLRISPSDPWDRQLLADALDLDRYLRQYGRSFPNEFPATNPGFYLAIAPGITTSIIASQLRATDDPSDVLFGLLIAKRLGGSVSTQLIDLIRERLAGATWGLIAHERHISEKVFLAMVIAALTPPTPAPSGGTGGGRSGGGTGGGSPSTTPSSRPSGQPSQRPSPTPPQSPSPTPTPTCGLLNQLLGGCH